MTNELARYEPPSTSLDLAPQAWKLAEKIASTEMVPTALKGRPEAVLAIMLAGHEAGVQPMQALQSIHIIEGRPAMSAQLMRALVMRHGHELIYEDVTTTKVVAAGRRKGSDRWTRVTWTMDDAKRGGLDGKQNWRKWPRAMLTARATAELCRMVFPDVLAGIAYTIEELDDGGEITAGAVDFGPAEIVEATAAPSAPPATATASRPVARAAQPADEPAAVERPRGEVPGLPDEPAPAAEPEPEPEEAEDEHGLTEADADGASDIVDAEIVDPDEWTSGEWTSGDFPIDTTTPEAQKRYTGPQIIAIKLADLFDIKGSGDEARAERLRAIGHILDREVASSKDLTPEETQLVITILDNWPKGEPLYDAIPEEPAPTPAETPETPEIDEEEAVAPPPRPSRSAASAPPASPRPEDWTGDQWRELLAARKVKVTETMKEASRLAALQEQTVATLDDIAGKGIAADLVGWVEDLSLDRRK